MHRPNRDHALHAASRILVGVAGVVLLALLVIRLPWIASTVAPGGTLFVVTFLRDVHATPAGRPWPLTKRELASFGRHGMTETARFHAPDVPGRLNVIFERKGLPQ